MAHIITDCLRQFKVDWIHALEADAIEDACRQAGHSWRRRVLDPITTIQLFFLQVVHGNVPMTCLPHLSGMTFTASAYCQARARIPLSVFERLLATAAARLGRGSLNAGRWLGHRVFLVDGSGFSMPDEEELQDAFGQPGAQKPGCGFPVAHITALFHMGTGMLTRISVGPLRSHDLTTTAAWHARWRKGDVLVADRGFSSYAHLSLHLRGESHAVIRIHQRQIVDFTPHRPFNEPGEKPTKGLPTSRWLRRLGDEDQLVEWFKPKEVPVWMTKEEYAELPDSIVVRELRYRPDEPLGRVHEITLVTTLTDAKFYPIDKLADLYRRRWEVETDLAYLKTTMGLDVLRSQTLDGVLKELYVFCLVYNLVRLVMVQASRRQKVASERISFVDALRWLATAGPDDPLPKLVVNPIRRRHEPRVRKRRSKNYRLMKRPRAELKQSLAKHKVTA